MASVPIVSKEASRAPATPGPGAPAARSIRVRELDLLRFIAALAVVLYHYTYHWTGSSDTLFPELDRITVHGYLGVNLFFMISGFVILWTARARSPSAFVISRITRLYPEFWLGVILSASTFAFFPLTPGPGLTLPAVLANLTMVPQVFGYPFVDGVYWTLSIELKFYALLWLLSAAGQMPRIESWVFGWLVLETGFFVFGAPRGAGTLTLHPFGPYFIAGCLFFLVRSDRLTVARGLGLLVCLVLSVVESLHGMGLFVQAADITAASRVATVAIIVSCYLAFFLISMRSTESGLASRLAFIGALTYPLYLTHNIAKAILLGLGGGLNRFLLLAIALSFSFILSSLMVLLIERRMRKPFTEFLTRGYQRLSVSR